MKKFTCTVNSNLYFAQSIEALKKALYNSPLSDAVFFEEEDVELSRSTIKALVQLGNGAYCKLA